MDARLQGHTAVTLTVDYTNKTFIVQHTDGTTEVFKTRTAAVERYPELVQPIQPLTRAQERARNKQDRRDTGEIRTKWGQWS